MRPRAVLLLTLFAPGVLGAPDDDQEAPHIAHEDISVTVAGQDLLVVAEIEDDSGVFDPTVLYRVGEEGAFLRAPMAATGEGATFSATIPGNLVVGDIQYFIEAFDEMGNGPARYGDQELPLRVRVVAPSVGEPESAAEPGGPTGPRKGEAKPSGEGGTDEAEEGSGVGLWLGLGAAGAGAAALIAVAAVTGGGIAAFVLLNDMGNPTPGEVTVVVTGPSVTPSALSGAGR